MPAVDDRCHGHDCFNCPCWLRGVFDALRLPPHTPPAARWAFLRRLLADSVEATADVAPTADAAAQARRVGAWLDGACARMLRDVAGWEAGGGHPPTVPGAGPGGVSG